MTPKRKAGKTALVMLLPGLGDAMIFSPVIQALADSGYIVDALTMLGSVELYARCLPQVRTVHHANLLERPHLAFSILARLRRMRYDLAMAPFPAARFSYAAFAALVGARRTVIHDYGGSSCAVARTFGADLVKLRGGHHYWENVRLANAIGIEVHNDVCLVPEAWRRSNRIDGLIGVHTGSMAYKGNPNKRWPIEKFAGLVAQQIQNGRRVRLFVGPHETEDANALQRRVSELEICAQPLDEAARRIHECSVFVANDNGIAHLAAGLGVPTIAIFGMTDPRRVQPLGPSYAYHPTSCPPCFDEGMQHFTCVRNIGYRCIREEAPIGAVSRLLDRALLEGLPPFVPLETSSFNLYGKARGDMVSMASTEDEPEPVLIS